MRVSLNILSQQHETPVLNVFYLHNMNHIDGLVCTLLDITDSFMLAYFSSAIIDDYIFQLSNLFKKFSGSAVENADNTYFIYSG